MGLVVMCSASALSMRSCLVKKASPARWACEQQPDDVPTCPLMPFRLGGQHRRRSRPDLQECNQERVAGCAHARDILFFGLALPLLWQPNRLFCHQTSCSNFMAGSRSFMDGRLLQG